MRVVVAEVELDREDQSLTKPSWVGEEVTHDPRFYDANLVANPFTKWKRSPWEICQASGWYSLLALPPSTASLSS